MADDASLIPVDSERPEPPAAAPHPAVDLALRLALGARGESVVQFRRDMHQRRQARVDHAWQAAVDDTGIEPDELLTRINADERLSDLFASTMDAALQTRWKAKLRALGKVLAQGVTADAGTQVDDAEAVARALEGLEAPHVRVLAGLEQVKRVNPGAPGGLPGWIAKVWPAAALTAPEIAAYIAARGLITDPFYGNGILSLSDLGQRVLTLVREAERVELGLPPPLTVEGDGTEPPS